MKREIHGLDIVVVRVFTLVVRVLRDRILQAGWPVDAGLNYEVEEEIPGLQVRVRIYPVGWPEANFIMVRFIKRGSEGRDFYWSPFEGTFPQGLGIQSHIFKLSCGLGVSCVDDWELRGDKGLDFGVFTHEDFPALPAVQ